MSRIAIWGPRPRLYRAARISRTECSTFGAWMPPSVSRSQIDALGLRLVKADVPAGPDLDALARLQDEYMRPLEETGRVLRDELGEGGHIQFRSVDLTMSNRLKTTGPILDKLRRNTKLSRMQDIVGFRIVGNLTLVQQDQLVRKIAAAFPRSKIVDRRKSPMHGYRAVHVIADADGFPVEIQVRTIFQDLWAQMMERLGDGIGREIRYGELPAGLSDEERSSVQLIVDRLKELSDEMAEHDRVSTLWKRCAERLELQRSQARQYRTRRLKRAVERSVSECASLSQQTREQARRVRTAFARLTGIAT